MPGSQCPDVAPTHQHLCFANHVKFIEIYRIPFSEDIPTHFFGATKDQERDRNWINFNEDAETKLRTFLHSDSKYIARIHFETNVTK